MAPQFVTVPGREVPIRASVDVLVCGSGLGGVAAAIASARAGARTLLVERNTFLGGTATAGMCCSIFNCYYTSTRTLGITGISLEIADALAAAEGYGERWRRHKGHIIYDIERAKLVLLEMVCKAGAELLLDTRTCDAVMEGDALRGVIIESKSGRESILAKVVVDATGDADLAAFAGAPIRVNEKGIHSLCFRMGNVDVDTFVGFFREHPDQYPEFMDVAWTLPEALAQYDDCGTFLFPHGGGMQMDAFKQAKADRVLPSSVGIQDTTDACQMHALRSTGMVHVITGFAHFNGLDVGQITSSINDGRRMAFVVSDVYRRYIPGFSQAFVAGTAGNLGVRVSRSLDGDFVFSSAMMAAGTRQSDVVGRAVGWDAQVIHPGLGAWACQVCHDDSFDLPYRCLLPKRIQNLLVGAGRSISTNNPYLLRVMAHTMVVGQAAGTAAAVAASRGETPAGVDVRAVQTELQRQGVEIA
ncbi:MAG: FAD-dependent oxidoreductase [Anaerolineae bacterium]